jgi:hypothetical protein
MAYSWQRSSISDEIPASVTGALRPSRGKPLRAGPLQTVPKGLARLPGGMDEHAEQFSRDMAETTELVLGQTETRLADADRIMGPTPERWSAFKQVPRTIEKARALGQSALTTFMLGPHEVASALHGVGRIVQAGLADKPKSERNPMEEARKFGENYQGFMRRLPGGDTALEMRGESDARLQEAGVGMLPELMVDMAVPWTPPIRLGGPLRRARMPGALARGAANPLQESHPGRLLPAIRDVTTGEVVAGGPSHIHLPGGMTPNNAPDYGNYDTNLFYDVDADELLTREQANVRYDEMQGTPGTANGQLDTDVMPESYDADWNEPFRAIVREANPDWRLSLDDAGRLEQESLEAERAAYRAAEQERLAGEELDPEHDFSVTTQPERNRSTRPAQALYDDPEPSAMGRHGEILQRQGTLLEEANVAEGAGNLGRARNLRAESARLERQLEGSPPAARHPDTQSWLDDRGGEAARALTSNSFDPADIPSHEIARYERSDVSELQDEIEELMEHNPEQAEWVRENFAGPADERAAADLGQGSAAENARVAREAAAADTPDWALPHPQVRGSTREGEAAGRAAANIRALRDEIPASELHRPRAGASDANRQTWADEWTTEHRQYLEENRGVDEGLFDARYDDSDLDDIRTRIDEHLENADFDEAYALARQYDFQINVDGGVHTDRPVRSRAGGLANRSAPTGRGGLNYAADADGVNRMVGQQFGWHVNADGIAVETRSNVDAMDARRDVTLGQQDVVVDGQEDIEQEIMSHWRLGEDDAAEELAVQHGYEIDLAGNLEHVGSNRALANSHARQNAEARRADRQHSDVGDFSDDQNGLGAARENSFSEPGSDLEARRAARQVENDAFNAAQDEVNTRMEGMNATQRAIVERYREYHDPQETLTMLERIDEITPRETAELEAVDRARAAGREDATRLPAPERGERGLLQALGYEDSEELMVRVNEMASAGDRDGAQRLANQYGYEIADFPTQASPPEGVMLSRLYPGELEREAARFEGRDPNFGGQHQPSPADERAETALHDRINALMDESDDYAADQLAYDNDLIIGPMGDIYEEGALSLRDQMASSNRAVRTRAQRFYDDRAPGWELDAEGNLEMASPESHSSIVARFNEPGGGHEGHVRGELRDQARGDTADQVNELLARGEQQAAERLAEERGYRLSEDMQSLLDMDEIDVSWSFVSGDTEEFSILTRQIADASGDGRHRLSTFHEDRLREHVRDLYDGGATESGDAMLDAAGYTINDDGDAIFVGRRASREIDRGVRDRPSMGERAPDPLDEAPGGAPERTELEMRREQAEGLLRFFERADPDEVKALLAGVGLSGLALADEGEGGGLAMAAGAMSGKGGLFRTSRLADIPKYGVQARLQQASTRKLSKPQQKALRAAEAKVDSALPNARANIERAIDEGRSWYNVQPLFEGIEDIVGPEQAGLMLEGYAARMGPTSINTRVPQNIDRALWAQNARNSGMEINQLDPSNSAPWPKLGHPYYYSAMQPGLQRIEDAEAAGRGALSALDPEKQFKTRRFGEAIKGNYQNVPPDLHMSRQFLQADSPNPAERRAIESAHQEVLGPEYDMEPSQSMAAQWVGGAEQTGISDSRGLMEIINERISLLAKRHGITEREMFERLVKGELEVGGLRENPRKAGGLAR